MKLSKRVWSVIAIASLLAEVLVVAAVQRAEAPAGLKSFAVPGGGEADRFQGKVTEVVTPTSEDGANYMQIDGHILVLMSAGGLRTGSDAGVKGGLIGGLGLGSRVEVYAAKVGKDSYTMYGSKDYYVKVVN